MQFFTKTAISCESCNLEQHLVKCQYCKACFCLNCIYTYSNETFSCLKCHAKYNKIIRYFIYKNNSHIHILPKVFEIRQYIYSLIPKINYSKECSILNSFINESAQNNYILSLYIDLIKGNYNINKYYKNLVTKTFSYDPSIEANYISEYTINSKVLPKELNYKKFRNKIKNAMQTELYNKPYMSKKNNINISNNIIFIQRNPRSYINTTIKQSPKKSVPKFNSYEIIIEKPIPLYEICNAKIINNKLIKYIESLDYNAFKTKYFIPYGIKECILRHKLIDAIYIENTLHNKHFNDIYNEIKDAKNYSIHREYNLDNSYYKAQINRDIFGYFIYRNHYIYTYDSPMKEFIPRNIFKYDLSISTKFFLKISEFARRNFYLNYKDLDRLITFCNIIQNDSADNKLIANIEQSIIMLLHANTYDYESINTLLSYAITSPRNKYFHNKHVQKNLITHIRTLIFKCPEEQLNPKIINIIDTYLISIFKDSSAVYGLYDFNLLRNELNDNYYQHYCKDILNDNNFNRVVNAKLDPYYHKLEYIYCDKHKEYINSHIIENKHIKNSTCLCKVHNEKHYQNLNYRISQFLKICPICDGYIHVIEISNKEPSYIIYCTRCFTEFNLKISKSELVIYKSLLKSYTSEIYKHLLSKNIHFMKRSQNKVDENYLCISPWNHTIEDNAYKYCENKVYNLILSIHGKITSLKNTIFENICLFLKNDNFAIGVMHHMNVQKCLLKIVIEFWRKIMRKYKGVREITEDIKTDIIDRFNTMEHNYSFINDYVMKFVENSIVPKVYDLNVDIFNDICKYVFNIYCGTDMMQDTDFKKMCDFMKKMYKNNMLEFNGNYGQIQIEYIKNKLLENNDFKGIDLDEYFDIIKKIILSKVASNVTDIINHV